MPLSQDRRKGPQGFARRRTCKRAAARAPSRAARLLTLVFGWLKTAGSITVVVWLLVTVCMQLKPRTLVEPVAVPKSLADHGVTGQVVQQQLAAYLNAVLVDANAEMPSQIRESVETDEPESNIELLDTGLSLDAVVHYTKRMFGIDDVYIRGSLRPAASGVCELAMTISHGASEQSFVVASPDSTERCADANENAFFGPRASSAEWRANDPTPLIALAADQVMQNRNLFIFAEAQSHRARQKCYADGPACHFDDATKSFQQILNDAGMARYYKWSWLALSKIDEDQGDYAGEVQKAMLSVKEDQTFSWGYYNWGIGLSERGCGEEALDAFRHAIRYGGQRPDFAFGYNAAGREALDLARADRAPGGEGRLKLRQQATGYLMMATELEPDYAEAYVNLGNAISELPSASSRDEAREQFLAAIALESQQLMRAVASMEEHGEGSLPSMVKVLRDSRTPAPICAFGGFARSVRDSNGCLTPKQQSAVHEKMPVVYVPPRLEAGRSRPDCRADGVAMNVGVLQPFLVNPVYSVEEPLTGAVPVMISH
jgi:tetratricopeptide (TPR) repeat protein